MIIRTRLLAILLVRFLPRLRDSAAEAVVVDVLM